MLVGTFFSQRRRKSCHNSQNILQTLQEKLVYSSIVMCSVWTTEFLLELEQ